MLNRVHAKKNNHKKLNILKHLWCYKQSLLLKPTCFKSKYRYNKDFFVCDSFNIYGLESKNSLFSNVINNLI